jgi:hypothetical protein
MSNFAPNVRRLANAEKRRVQILSQRFLVRAACYFAAVLIGSAALVMFAISGFFALEEEHGAPISALIMGAVLALIAAIAVFVASQGGAGKSKLQQADHEIKLARLEMERNYDELQLNLNRMSLGLLGVFKSRKGSSSKRSSSLFPLLLAALGALMRRK